MTTADLRNSIFTAGQPSGVSRVVRDSAGRLTAWVENGFTMTLTRDPAGNPLRLVAQSGQARLQQEFGFDAAGRLVTTSGHVIPTVMAGELAAPSQQAVQALVSGDWNTRPVISAAVRAQINQGTTTQGSTYITYRTVERAIKRTSSPVFEFWNGHVITNGTHGASPETPIATAVSRRASVLTNVSGSGLNQSGATLTRLRFFGMKDDAAFVAAGGVVSSDGYTVTCPAGMWVRSDPAHGVVLQGTYMHQHEEQRVVGETVAYAVRTRYDLGDAKFSSSTQQTKVLDLDWTGATVSGSTQAPGPCAIYGYGPAGTRCVLVEGDSVIQADKDFDGDANGARGFAKRALNAAGYPFFSVAVPGTNIDDMYLWGGFANRLRFLKYCHAVITDMGHNDRTGAWSAALPKFLWHTGLLRSGAIGSARVVRCTLGPNTNSTSGDWLSDVDQTYKTAVATPGTGWQYANYAPYLLRTGAYAGVAFDPLAGDPDAAFDLYAALGASNGYWPSNGTPDFGTDDGLHPSPALHIVAAAAMQPQLPALLGF